MIRQFFSIIWKQRRRNSLLVVEIVLSFVALFVLSGIVIHYYKKYKEPLGMEYRNVWALSAYQDWNLPRDQKLSDSVRYIRLTALKQKLLENDQVLSVSFCTFSDFLYYTSMSSSCFDLNKKQHCYETFNSEPDFAKTAGLKITEGRWILPEDQYSAVKPCVINERFRKEMFGDKPAAGKMIKTGEGKDVQKFKVVGVIANLKRHGEFSDEPNFLIDALPKKADYLPWGGMLIRLKDHIPGTFEATLVNSLVKFDKSFEYRIEKVESLRRQYLLSELAPVIIAGAVVIFLIVNVMLGLFGTLWLNISRRKPEIGLRRAVGSTSHAVLWQILVETYVLAAASLILGGLITSQIFIFNIYDTPVATLIQANLVAFAIIMVLCTISAFAPARLASRLKPAEALHEE
ncbi:MAG TPA: FtsX-like permease family protein [Bacteroidales bacterium]|nr:FtsX-like permease family protein [Bacteroidales bacterium]